MTPPGWREVPIGALYRRRAEANRPELPLLSVYRDLGVVLREGREDNFNKPGEDLGSYQVVRPGFLVLNKMKTWQGSLGVSSFDGIVSPAYFVAEQVGDIEPRFMHHLLRSRPLIAEYGARSKGIRPNQWDLPWEEFRAIRVRLPGSREQRAIADYLDAETARIDALVANRRQQVHLFGLRRSIVVVQLAMGSGEGGAGRATGSPPRFPEGWARTRLRYLVQPPQSGDWGDEPTGVDDTFVVRAADFDRRSWRIDQAHLPLRAVERHSVLQRQLRAGDLVLEKSGGGPDQPVGAAVSFDLDVNAVPSNFAARLRSADRIDPRFLCYALAATYEIGLNQRSIKQTTGIQNLDMSAYLSEAWAVPSYPEQVRIRTEIEVRLAAIDALQTASEGQIDLLLERRQALITAAVTGQLQIPGIAA